MKQYLFLAILATTKVQLMPWLHVKENNFEIISVIYFTCNHRNCLYLK